MNLHLAVNSICVDCHVFISIQSMNPTIPRLSLLYDYQQRNASIIISQHQQQVLAKHKTRNCEE